MRMTTQQCEAALLNRLANNSSRPVAGLTEDGALVEVLEQLAAGRLHGLGQLQGLVQELCNLLKVLLHLQAQGEDDERDKVPSCTRSLKQ